MSDHSSGTNGPGHASKLLLRVRRPGGGHDEFYLSHGLTIGRTAGNTIVLDDPTVDRTHARVEIGGDGSARLQCIGTGGSVIVGGTWVRELPLNVGARFRVGTTEFECVSGQRAA